MPRICLPIVAAAGALIFVVLISGASGEELLVNGGFETGDTQGWSVAGNELQISTVAHSGGYAGQLTSDGLEQNVKIYQSVLVQASRKYQFSGWILQNDPAVTQVMLQINWFDADDNLVLISQSRQLTDTDAAYRELTTGELTPPQGAAWARAFVSVAGSGVFSVYVDDLSLSGIDPPVPTDTPVSIQDTPTPNDSVSATPALTASASVSPTPTGSPAASPTPTSVVTASPTRIPTASPTRTPSPTPAPRTPVPTPAEPRVFQSLTNTGFEDLRDDGTPYGWRKVGGEIAVTDEERIEGDLALAISSETSSTKWAYEGIGVTPGAYYAGEAWAMNTVGADTLLLRVSWYASDDASGSAIDSTDSLSTVSGDSGGFRQLSTGPVQAPANARSVRVRLLLEPGSAAPTRAFFDGVSFGETAWPDSSDPNGVVQSAPTSRRNAAQLTDGATLSATTDPPSPTALDARATPAVLANVRPPKPEVAQLGQSGGGSSTPWLALAIAVPAVAIGAFAAAEAVRLRRRRARPAGESQPRGRTLPQSIIDGMSEILAAAGHHAPEAETNDRPGLITVDGSAASGKSTIGRQLAARLGYRFLDTGIMYRAITRAALERGIDVHDAAALTRLAASIDMSVVLTDPRDPTQARISIDGRDVTEHLRAPEVDENVSLVSRVAGVREALVQRQRAIAEPGRIVMAGRDIGTVVLPDAGLKVYLDASPEERARRRYGDFVASGRPATEDAVLQDLRRRDQIDRERDVSPLRPADDAVKIDTDGLTQEQVLERVLRLIERAK
jgi:cytidylate kinase